MREESRSRSKSPLHGKNMPRQIPNQIHTKSNMLNNSNTLVSRAPLSTSMLSSDRDLKKPQSGKMTTKRSTSKGRVSRDVREVKDTKETGAKVGSKIPKTSQIQSKRKYSINSDSSIDSQEIYVVEKRKNQAQLGSTTQFMGKQAQPSLKVNTFELDSSDDDQRRNAKSFKPVQKAKSKEKEKKREKSTS